MAKKKRSATSSSPVTPVEDGAPDFTADVPKKKESGASVNFAPVKHRQGVVDVCVEGLDLAFYGTKLLEDAKIELFTGHRYGMVGVNGCGKSTLLTVMGSGEIDFPPELDYFHVKEEIEASSTTTAIEAVTALCASENARLENELEQLAGGDGNDARMDQIYHRMEELDPDMAETRASKILFGLGFTDDKQRRVTASFSGGWRMRIALAQALFQNPTLLLLDEPTNHLDVEAVVWLENYLAKFDKILFMVSHSQDFMNGVCTNIVHMTQSKLKYYDGNYDTYMSTRANLEINQTKNFDREQAEIAHMKDYIRRFEHANEKRSRQAQSKMKVLDKMERGGLTESVHKDRDVNFAFGDGGKLPPPLVQFTDVAFAYPGCELLYRGLNLGIDSESRICLVGPNGAGKTTLTKMMIRELEATEGLVNKNAHCRIARFHQHFVDVMDMSQTPLQFFQSEFPGVTDILPFRASLSKFGISGNCQSTEMDKLSDGQKSRVVLAWMSHRAPHLMILDEPTNHLDIESIDALAEGLNDYGGAVIVISHDLRLIAQVADEIWICEDGKVQPFNGDIGAYKKHVQRQVAKMENAHNKTLNTKSLK